MQLYGLALLESKGVAVPMSPPDVMQRTFSIVLRGSYRHRESLSFLTRQELP